MSLFYNMEDNVRGRKLASTDQLTEKEQCVQIQTALFHNHHEAKKNIMAFHRLLPRLYYALTHPPSKDIKDQEVPMGYERNNFLGPIGPNCKTDFEKYGVGDEEKRACGLTQIIKMEKEMNAKSECIIYSIGSNNQWGFEEAIFEKTNCRVETFDCTTPATIKPPEAIQSRVRYHNICLGSENKGKFKTWKGLHEITGIKTAPTFLKMDIEGFEFAAIQIMIDEGYLLPLQIAMELHIGNRLEPIGVNGEPSWSGKDVTTGEIAAFMQYMHEFGGYYLVDRRDNCGHCAEILLAKLNCENHAVDENTYASLKKQTHSTLATAINKALTEKYYSAKL